MIAKIFNNKKILITGGTGSFGKKFIETIYKISKPKKMIIYSRDEFKQSNLRKEYTKKNFKGVRYFIGDVRDKNRLREALNGVDIVIHAAALKHIEIAEENPQECVKTNIFGTQNLIEVCIEKKVKKMIALSTDKAANPINLYGATKLAAEKLIINSNILSNADSTILSVVRYGNVINSRGSVIPYFKSLVDSGIYTLPLTDYNMTRFFITLEESVNFVISCIAKMKGGEVFIPKMPSIRITDIGKAISSKIKFRIIGKRSGEKNHEILCPQETSDNTYEFKKYFIIASSIRLPERNNIKHLIRKERGKKVSKEFVFSSDKNKFLTIKEIKKILNKF
ncbi:UDP-N-acetylglucosamine 4,6-dehydratase (inverting) [Candidatus Pelagibacter sp. HIMB1587]|uniref:UDP-N-acetylglucosamine 4,6-dehydratase (inverting) n=1 Tax=Candidatus Pelagibacter sp. HIMB1587 TaxID=3413354 RepID=UPI003F826E43